MNEWYTDLQKSEFGELKQNKQTIMTFSGG